MVQVAKGLSPANSRPVVGVPPPHGVKLEAHGRSQLPGVTTVCMHRHRIFAQSPT